MLPPSGSPRPCVRKNLQPRPPAANVGAGRFTSLLGFHQRERTPMSGLYFPPVLADGGGIVIVICMLVVAAVAAGGVKRRKRREAEEAQRGKELPPKP